MFTPWVRRIALLLLSLNILTSHAEVSQERPLIIAVAANFADAAAQISARFTENTGVPVRLVMGSTGLLYAQITQGAPIDLLLAADTDRPRALMTKNIATDLSYAVYARGRLVLWVPGATHPPELADFMTESASMALANPALAPYGRAASQVMARFSKQASSMRIVRGQNISTTYTQVATGSVPGGFVALSQVLAQGVPPSEYRVIPEAWHEPIEQALVLINHQDMHPHGQNFRHFLLSEQASVMLNALGYVVGG